MKNKANITLVQLTEKESTLSAVDRMEPFFINAKKNGSDLIVFPEYSLGRRITIDSPSVMRFRELARIHKINAVAGLIESIGDRWSTTAIVVDRDGKLLGKYLKTHPAGGPPPHDWPPLPDYDNEARGILGSEFKVFELDFGPITILQCYDGMFPEAWTCAGWSGAEIILWINGRPSMIQDAFCITAAHCYGCVVAACISDGWNTGFAEPRVTCINAPGKREEMRLFPRIMEKGDASIHATIDLAALRVHRKHLRTMHQRRPELYTPQNHSVTTWQNYPDIPWAVPECQCFTNKAQLKWPPDMDNNSSLYNKKQKEK